jgi:hypothetical protein
MPVATRLIACAALLLVAGSAPAFAQDDARKDAKRAQQAAKAAETARDRAEAAYVAAKKDKQEARRDRERPVPDPAQTARPAPVGMTVDPFTGGNPNPAPNCYDSPKGCPAPAPRN